MIKTLGSQIAVIEDTSEEGIIVSTSPTQPMTGKVVSVGPGRKSRTGARIPMDIEIGDRVVYTRFSGQHTVVDDQKYLVMDENDVIGIAEDGVKVEDGEN